MQQIVHRLPQYDFIYLGDNARAPYGNRSFDTVHQYTLEAVRWFFSMNCSLVILACNTASAKALRTIQQKDLPSINAEKRVLGVIRPTTEIIGNFTKTGSVGILATTGTVQSESYPIEIEKFFPAVRVFQQACPMWVPLIENNDYNNPGADYFVKKYIEELFKKANDIDTILLACTHYPLLKNKISTQVPSSVSIISQGEIVANSLADYLQRHPEIENKCSKNGKTSFFTTDSTTDFDAHASIFYDKAIHSSHVPLS